MSIEKGTVPFAQKAQKPFALRACNKESPANFFLWKTGENHHIHIQFTRINDVEHHLLLKIDTDMYLEREFSCSLFVPAQFQQNLNSFTYVFFFFFSLSANPHLFTETWAFHELGHSVLCFYSICYFYNKFDRIFMFSDELCIKNGSISIQVGKLNND